MKRSQLTVLALIFGALILPRTILAQQLSGYPGDREDGVSTEIRADEIQDLRKWSKRTRYDLQQGLFKIGTMSTDTEADQFRALIDKVIDDSGNLRSETLMRSTLRRARIVDDEILKSHKRTSERTRLLKDAVLLAIEVYGSDDSYFAEVSGRQANNNNARLDFLKLVGVPHAHSVIRHIELVPDLQAQLNILVNELGLLFNDARNDIVRRRPLAPNIAAILSEKTLIDETVAHTEPVSSEAKLAFVAKVKVFLKQQVSEIESNQSMH